LASHGKKQKMTYMDTLSSYFDNLQHCSNYLTRHGEWRRHRLSPAVNYCMRIMRHNC